MGSSFYIWIEGPNRPAQRWQYGAGYQRGGLYVAPKYTRRRIETVHRQILAEARRHQMDPLRHAVLRARIDTLMPGERFAWVKGLTAWIEEVPDKPEEKARAL